MTRIFREPLIHFLLIGALLFIFFEMFGGAGEESGNAITITVGEQKMVQENFARTWQRPPTQEELDGLIEDKVRDEIAYFEAVAMGLDKEDPYIRRRLRMKLELLVEDLAASAPPSEEELLDYLERNREKFREESQTAFSHVYLKADRQAGLSEDVAALLSQLKTAEKGELLENYGDAIMLPRVYPLTPASVIDRQLGQGFSEAVNQMEPGIWLGPVKSSYGYHLVRLEAMVPGYDPPLSEIRDEVERELLADRRQEMLEKAYERLREKYTVVVESQAEQG